MLLCDCGRFLPRCGGVGAGPVGPVGFLTVGFDILPDRDDAALCKIYCRVLFLARPSAVFAGADTRPALWVEFILLALSRL